MKGKLNADAICEKLDDLGVTSAEWERIRDMMERTKHLEVKKWAKGDEWD